MIFTSEFFRQRFESILQDGTYPLKPHGFRRATFGDILVSKRVYRKTADKLLSIYNDYFETDESLLSIFRSESLIGYFSEDSHVGYTFSNTGSDEITSFIDEVLARKKGA